MKKVYEFLVNENGNVILEFTVAAVALFIPISYISIATTQVASSYIEVQNAARAGARLFASSEIDAVGKRSTSELIYSMLNSSTDVIINFDCTKTPCLSKDGIVTVEVQKEVTLNLPLTLSSPRIFVTGKQAEVVQDSQ